MNKLYIIHGWSFRNTQPWEQVKEYLAKDGIKAELLCVPGFDLTKKDDKVYTIQDYVKFAKKNIPKGSIALGHSNGGRILLNLLSEDPGYLKGAILLSSAGIYEESRKRNVLRKLSKIFAPLKDIKILRKVLYKVIGASDYDKAPENMKKTLTNMLDSDKNLELESIDTPIRIIWGKEDHITPLRHGQKIKSIVKNATIKTVPEWNHAPYLNHPQELANIIKQEYVKLTEKK